MTESNALIQSLPDKEVIPLLQRALVNVRDDVADNPYIKEALKVLPVGGYRSAIGSFWNAVVDDLRNKIIYRSVELFNKSITISPAVKTYEDFQQRVNDDQLIEGAYKIGVIGWEASKVLKHSKETRHIFDGHPKSSEPSILKVLAMMEDCTKYVLKEPYPNQIIDIDDYISNMDSASFDRNSIAIVNALSELPEVYKNDLSNRIFAAYINTRASTVLRSNIEFVVPILWRVLPKDIKLQIVRRVDLEIPKGNSDITGKAFDFVTLVSANSYLSITAREYFVKPLIDKLKSNLDQWDVENECTKALAPYAAHVPPSLLEDYVTLLTHTYVGYIGGSAQYSRKDFYANAAAVIIPSMFEKFDDSAAEAFVINIKTNGALRRRITHPMKLARLRSLANIVQERVSVNFADKDFLEKLCDTQREEEFLKSLPKAVAEE